jgi:hypothetical protein
MEDKKQQLLKLQPKRQDFPTQEEFEEAQAAFRSRTQHLWKVLQQAPTSPAEAPSK